MIVKGLLYEHTQRPAWGFAMLIDTVAGKPRLRFTDGEVRTLIDAQHLRQVGEDQREPAGVSEPERRTRRDPPGQRKKSTSSPKPRELGDEWTEVEDAKLRKLYKSMTDAQLVEHFDGRTRAGIRKRRYRLKLDRAPAWTAAQVARVMHSAEPDAAIAKDLGRTLQSIRSCRVRHKAARKPKPTDWTADDVARFERAALDGTKDRELAFELGRSVQAVRLYRARRKKAAKAST